jgi:hypothetical protein
MKCAPLYLNLNSFSVYQIPTSSHISIDKVGKINRIFLIDQLRLNQPRNNPTIFYDKAVVIHQNNQNKNST